MLALLDHNQAARTSERSRPKPSARGGKNVTEYNSVWQSLALRPTAIQPKLNVSQPGDPYEREADHVADRVMRMTTVPASAPDFPFSSAPSFKAQRKCVECGEEEQKVQRKEQGGHESSIAAPSIIQQTLHSQGQPLDTETRAFMEPRFGHDFGKVRVHTDERAAEAASSIAARAFTMNHDIVFGVGEFAPQGSEGRQLLAHELAHVMQQGETGQPRRIFRQPQLDPPPNMLVEDKSESLLNRMLATINNRTDKNLQLRQQLDALPETSSSARETLTAELDAGRLELMNLLKERIALLNTAIGDLWVEFSTRPMASLMGRPENDALGYKLNRYERQLEQHQSQFNQLSRWQTRQQIASIDAEIAQIDGQLAHLPPVSDPDAPEAELLALQRADLLEQRKSLVQSLLSGAHEYKQFDPRWGSKRYGTSTACTNIKEGGCGPTSLAILLNYLYAEDPEALSSSTIEFVTPDETATYAATHGRVCNNGTVGPTMVTQVSTQWPGFRGRSVTLDQAVTEARNGNLVIFLCHNCTGQTKTGGNKNYGGHFMVLNGVDNAGATFNVLDPGAKEAGDIETITKTELLSHGAGYWIVERK